MLASPSWASSSSCPTPPRSRTASSCSAACGVSALASEFGTPLVVYCEETLRARARAYREAAPDAVTLYGSKAFPNAALLALFAEEGLGADVSTLGELELALRAGVPAERIVVHGNNKSDDELRRAAEADVWLVVLDAEDEVERAAAAGVRRVLVRVTPGIDPDTHDAIKTGHRGSKFGLPAGAGPGRDRPCAPTRTRRPGPARAPRLSAPRRLAGAVLGRLARRLRGRVPLGARLDTAGRRRGRRARHPLRRDGHGAARSATSSDTIVDRVERAWALHGLPVPRLVFEPGRSLVGEAGVTLYRVGVVKRSSETTTYVAVDGGMSDNPRPQLYEARFSCLLANRADEATAGTYTVCGKHCESGDVLVERAPTARPGARRPLAVPATGAYTLAMASNYNVVPRPAAVLVSDGSARLIRRRETLDDLLSLET